MGNKDAIEYALKVLYSKELNPESENISGETSDLSEADMEYALAVVVLLSDGEKYDIVTFP